MPTVTMILKEGTRRIVYFKGDKYKLKGMQTAEVPEEVHDYLMSLNEGRKIPLFASGGLLVKKRATTEVEEEEAPKKKVSTRGRKKKTEEPEGFEDEEFEEDAFGEQKEL